MIKKILQVTKYGGFRRYAINTGWLISEKIVRMITMLIVGIWIARYLGPESFGLFSFAQSLVFLFTAFATLGMDSIIVRELVKDNLPKHKILGTAFLIKLCGAILLLPIVTTTSFFISNDYLTNLIVFILAFAIIFQSFNVIDYYFQSKVISKYVSIANFTSLAISSVIKVIFIINKAPLVYFAFVAALDSLIVAFGLIYFFYKHADHNIYMWKFDWTTAKWLIRESWPLMLSGLVVSLYMKVDQVMIKTMINSEAVGQYAAAIKISEVWYIIPMVILNSFFPAIINAKKISDDIYRKRLIYLYSWMVWLGIMIAIPISFLGDSIILITFGPQYIEAATVLIIHIWSAVFVFLGVAFSKYLVTEGLVLKSFYRTASGAILNILLNIWLIRYYGIIGAAIASLFSQIFANFIYDLFDVDLRNQFYLKLRAFNPINLIFKI